MDRLRNLDAYVHLRILTCMTSVEICKVCMYAREIYIHSCKREWIEIHAHVYM
jgi:hypothetical protein